jgi:cytochrome P450
LWKPLTRLVGEPSGADPAWPLKKGAFRELLSGPNIASFADDMAAAIVAAVDEVGGRAAGGRPIDAGQEMTNIIYRAITQILVGDKISVSEADHLGVVLAEAASSSFRLRMLFPFVPFWMPVPGDLRFRRAVKAADDLIFPIVRSSREKGADGGDVVSRLLRARGEDGRKLDDQGVRDGIVALFVAATETSVTALTFLWMMLDAHPEVATKLREEIDRVVGTEQPKRSHLPELRYAKMVAEEVLRLCPPAWITPRLVVDDDVIDGVRIKKGSILIISPYLTHRLEEFWDRTASPTCPSAPAPTGASGATSSPSRRSSSWPRCSPGSGRRYTDHRPHDRIWASRCNPVTRCRWCWSRASGMRRSVNRRERARTLRDTDDAREADAGGPREWPCRGPGQRVGA